MKKLLCSTFVFCVLVIFFTLPLQAIAFQDREKTLERLSPALNHLLGLVEKNSRDRFDAGKIGPILEFMTASKSLKTAYSLGKRKGASSAYHEFTINRSLEEVMDLVYNPEIPSYVTSPSSVRRSHWIEVNGKRQPLPKLSHALDDLSGPFIVKGVEFIENTPDANTGAYYAYELDRTLILLRHQGRRVLLSISNQRDKSNVGKKGLVLGRDDDWNYLYTGEKGCTLKGLAWADSYMYNSSSIIVYYETNDPAPQVKCGTFKWLKAGWAGLNLVKAHHLLEGIKRFAASFKEIVESPALADVPELSRIFARIGNLSMEELREKSRVYFEHLRRRFKDESRLARKWLSELLRDKGYLAKMHREEMEVILCIEYLKHLLDKGPRFDISYFEPVKPAAKRPG
ncbi:MAG: hypothetical protein GY849_20165 [Deltaproteobacteria bacterium]|nr:hypothetical protein [Deltaproteobacteria bacterium]